MSKFTKKCMAYRTAVRQRPAGHTFLFQFWHFQMAVSCLLLGLFTPNLGILWISVCSFRLCVSMVANPIIYRLVPSPSRYEIRQCAEYSFHILSQSDLPDLTGSPWIADFRCWTKPELSIPAAGQKDRGSGDENAVFWVNSQTDVRSMIALDFLLFFFGVQKATN